MLIKYFFPLHVVFFFGASNHLRKETAFRHLRREKGTSPKHLLNSYLRLTFFQKAQPVYEMICAKPFGMVATPPLVGCKGFSLPQPHEAGELGVGGTLKKKYGPRQDCDIIAPLHRHSDHAIQLVHDAGQVVPCPSAQGSSARAIKHVRSIWSRSH